MNKDKVGTRMYVYIGFHTPSTKRGATLMELKCSSANLHDDRNESKVLDMYKKLLLLANMLLENFQTNIK